MYQEHAAASWELSCCASAAKKHLHSIQVHDLPSQPTPCIPSPELSHVHGIPATDLPAALTCGLKVVIHQKSNRVYPAGIARESRHSESHIPRRACMHRMPWQRSSVSSLICTSCRATEGGNIRPLAERLRSRVYLGASSRYKEPCHV